MTPDRDENDEPEEVDENDDDEAVEDAEVLDASGEVIDPLGNNERRPLPKLKALQGSHTLAGGGDLLTHYLQEIRRYSLLDPEEERRVAKMYYVDGDASAAERLVTANLRLVVKIAFQYHRQWANVLDLIQEGNVGLVEALSRFDPTRNIRFSSYAQYWIRAMILRFLMDNFRLVRLGSTRNGRKLFFQLQKERQRLLAEGHAATPRALAERLEVPESEIIAVDQHMRAPAMSLTTPVSGEEGRPLSEVVADHNQRGPEEQAVGNQLGQLMKERLANFAKTLEDERERDIWRDRLMANEPASLSDIGDKHKVSKERIRQIEARIKARLKTYMQNEFGAELDLDFDVES